MYTYQDGIGWVSEMATQALAAGLRGLSVPDGEK